MSIDDVYTGLDELVGDIGVAIIRVSCQPVYDDDQRGAAGKMAACKVSFCLPEITVFQNAFLFVFANT